MSTPILAPVVGLVTGGNALEPKALFGAFIANVIGSLIFFWVDRLIFKTNLLAPTWEVLPQKVCSNCGSLSTGFRIVKYGRHDWSDDPNPKYRCMNCSGIKAQEVLNAN